MLKNGLYNIIGAVIRIGITFLTIPVIIRSMGVETYGLWTLVSTVLGIVSLAQAGLSTSTTVFLSKDLANGDIKGISQTLTVTLGGMAILATTAAVSLWFGADSLLVFFPKLEVAQRTEAAQALKIGALVIWTRLLQQIFVGVEQAYQCYGMMNILNTLQICSTNIIMMVMVWKGTDTTGLMVVQAAMGLGGLFGHICFSGLLLGNINLHLIWDNKRCISIVRHSSMTWFTSLGSAIFSQCDKLIVGGVLGAKLLGVYAAITSITSNINTFSGIAIQPLLPKLSSLLKGKIINYVNLKQQIKQALQVNVLLAFGLGTILLVATPFVMNMIIGQEVTREYQLGLYIATIVYSLYSANAVGYYALLSCDAAHTCMLITVSSSICTLILIYFGATSLGLLGAILGNIGFIGTLLCNIVMMKNLKIAHKEWMSWLQPKEFSLLIINLIGRRQKI